jgi:hypothetical protein
VKLGEIITTLTSDDSRTIVARRPWSEESEARLVALTDEHRVPSDVLHEGFEYFLEVDIALNEVLGERANLLSPSQKIAAVVYYADNDAFPDWMDALS